MGEARRERLCHTRGHDRRHHALGTLMMPMATVPAARSANGTRPHEATRPGPWAPTAPAERAPPAKSFPPRIAAPIIARAMPTVRIPAIAPACPEVLRVLNHRRHEAVEMRDGGGSGCGTRRSDADQADDRSENSSFHIGSFRCSRHFNGKQAELRLNDERRNAPASGRHSEIRSGPLGWYLAK